MSTRSLVARATRRQQQLSLPRAAVAAAFLGAATLLTSTPSSASASDWYSDCLSVVDDYHSSCRAGAGNFATRFACDWTAGVAILACATGEAARQLGSSVKVPTISPT